ncbi:hypothetical protein GCM10023334_067350 [Nonomuraea thailandensis]
MPRIKLRLASGAIEETADVTITFPTQSGTAGKPVAVAWPFMASASVFGGVPTLVALSGMALYLLRHFRRVRSRLQP